MNSQVHRINMHIEASLYPHLHEAIKNLKPRSKAEMIRKLAEIALILLEDRKRKGNDSNYSPHDNEDKELNDEIASLFQISGEV